MRLIKWLIILKPYIHQENHEIISLEQGEILRVKKYKKAWLKKGSIYAELAIKLIDAGIAKEKGL